MIKIQLDLTITQLVQLKALFSPKQIEDIASILNNTYKPSPIEKPTMEPIVFPKSGFQRPEVVEGVATRKKGGNTGPKMPGLGRTPEQVTEFIKSEEDRTIELDEETEVKKQRAEERQAKQAEKDRVTAEKKAEEDKEQAEIDAIKAKNALHEEKVVTEPLVQPWKSE